MANYGGLQPWDNSPQSAMRASDADRERAVDVLKAGFAEGRLSHEEYDQRVGAVYRSRTYGELTALVRDLPQGPVVPPMQMAVPQHAMPVMPTFLPTPPPPTNSLATASLVCGLAGTVFVLPAAAAVVLGHRARGQIRRTGEQGEGTATVGAVLGYLGLTFWVLILLVMIAG